MQGWIKLHRQLLEHDWMKEKRVYSKAEAWIDLLLRANHKDEKLCFNSNWITIQRGQHLTSMKKLGERWQWSRTKVQKFLELLEQDGMCTSKKTSKYTLLTIDNYDFYQSQEYEKKHQKDIKKTSERHQKSTNKNELRMIKNGEEVYTAPTLIKGGRNDGDKESPRTPTYNEFFK